jgi:hypothetical protein
MERPARVPGEPRAHLGVLVSGIVVEDGVNELAGRHGGLDAVEETDEFLVAMTRHALAITVPSRTLSAANSVVVPCRMESWVIVPARPFLIGRPGYVRSSS